MTREVRHRHPLRDSEFIAQSWLRLRDISIGLQDGYKDYENDRTSSRMSTKFGALMKRSDAPLSVGSLDEAKRIPWRARKRLRRAQKSGRTGVLLIAEIREPIRSFTDRAGTVSIRKNGVKVCSRSRFTKAPKFVDLAPGLHELEFSALSRGGMQKGRVQEVS